MLSPKSTFQKHPGQSCYISEFIGVNWLQKIATNRSDELQSIIDKWTSVIPNLVLYVYEQENRIVLSNIIVPKSQRKQGFGSQIVQDLVNYADQTGKLIELSPGIKDKYQGTTSRNRLVRFYKRFGFLENRGRNADYSRSESMFRNPTQKLPDTPLES